MSEPVRNDDSGTPMKRCRHMEDAALVAGCLRSKIINPSRGEQLSTVDLHDPVEVPQADPVFLVVRNCSAKEG